MDTQVLEERNRGAEVDEALEHAIAIGDRNLQRLVHLRPAVAFLQDLRVQLDAEATDIIDQACKRSTPISLQGAA